MFIHDENVTAGDLDTDYLTEMIKHGVSNFSIYPEFSDLMFVYMSR